PLRRNGASAVSESLWTNADDCLPVASLGRVEGGDGIVEGRDVADVRPQSSVPHPLDDLTQLRTIGLDNEVDRQAVGGSRLGRADDGHQCSSGSNHACGPLLDVPNDDVEHHALQETGISREDLVDEPTFPSSWLTSTSRCRAQVDVSASSYKEPALDEPFPTSGRLRC